MDNLRDAAAAPVGSVGGEQKREPPAASPLPQQETPHDVAGSAFANGGYADAPEVRDWIKQELVGRITAIRQARLAREEQWADAWRMWAMEHDRQGYKGRANLYIPAAHKAIEIVVSAASSALFPTDDIISVQAPPGGSPQDAEAAATFQEELQHDLISRAAIKREIKVFLRQFFVTGSSPLKTLWGDERKRVKRRSQSPVRIMGQVVPPMTEFEDEAVIYRGPVVRTVDLFNFYVWPETARSVREAELVFEVMELSPHVLRRREAQGVYTNVEKALQDFNSTLPNPNLADLAARTTGILLPPENPGTSGRERPVRVLEIWCNLKLPNAESRGYSKDFPEPAVVTMTEGGVILRATPNPFDHGEPPYELAKLEETLYTAYGFGRGNVLGGLQRLLNDQMNQAQDVAAFTLNPVVKRSTIGVGGALPAMRPGVIWNVLSPGDIQFETPPWQLAQVGIEAATRTIGFIQEFSGAPPILQAQNPVGRGARTARGMQILQSNSMMPLQDVVEDIEEQVLRPMLYKAAVVREQFMPSGRPVHTYLYRWLASDQAMNQQVRSQQMVELLQIAGSFVPLLQQFGLTINPAPVLRRLYVEGFGFRDPDSFIVPAVMPGAPSMPGAGPAKKNGALSTEIGDIEGRAEGQGEAGAGILGALTPQLGPLE